MNAMYQLDSITNDSFGGSMTAVEVCATLVGPSEDHTRLHSLIYPTTTLFIQGDLKGHDDPVVGYDPASNFRDKKKADNDRVVANWMNLFEVYQRVRGPDAGVVCTSIPRSERYLTIRMGEEGLMQVLCNWDNSLVESSTTTLQNFLNYEGITERRVLAMREASKGARYQTYFADLQALLLSINFTRHPEMFEKVFMTPTVVRPGDKELMDDGSVTPILREKKLPNDKVWTPKDMDYLYFVKSNETEKKHCPHSQSFYRPRPRVVSKLYAQIDQLLSNGDNGQKKMVREHFSSMSEWHRWSDYWVNDVDDAITILAIIHAFKFCSLTDSEKLLLSKFELIAKPWFDKFASDELRSFEPEPEPEPEPDRVFQAVA